MQPEMYLSDVDQKLKSVIEQVKLQRPVSTNQVFHDLMSCIIEQQIHYRSTKTHFQKLIEQSWN